MARKYRTFSADFKLDTVMEGFRGEKSIAQICRERGIKDVLYYKWRDTFLENAVHLSSDEQEAINKKLIQFERAFLHDGGLDFSPWLQSLYAAPDPYSGYASWMLPAYHYAYHENYNHEQLIELDSIHAQAIERMIKMAEGVMGE